MDRVWMRLKLTFVDGDATRESRLGIKDVDLSWDGDDGGPVDWGGR